MVETLAVGETPLFPKIRCAIAHPGFERLEVAHLARMAADRLELEFHGLGDVDDETRLLPLDEVRLTNAVRLVLARQFRKGKMVSRERVDAVEDHAASDPVVPMPPWEVVVRAVRIQGDDDVGSPLTNLAGNVAPELARVFQLAILVAEELNAPHAEHVGGSSLFLLSNRCELLRRNAPIT